MYKITEKKVLNDFVVQMLIEAPHVANKAKPGQFIILRVDDNGERKSEIVNEEDNFQYVEYAYVLVVDVESGAEELFKKETKEVTLQASQPIQNLGGKNTYMKRYMYMDVFEINENDSVEEETGAPANVETKVETKTKSRKKISCF